MKFQDLKQTEGETFELPERVSIKFACSSAEPIIVSADNTILFHLEANKFHIKTLKLQDRESLTICPKKGSMSLIVQMTALRKGEEIDDLPPPPPPEANNLLAQIREKVRREMGVTRESFLLQNDTGRPGYEIDDDEDELFEEEIALKEANEKKKAEAKAKADQEKKDAAQAAPKPEAPKGAEENQQQTKGEQMEK